MNRCEVSAFRYQFPAFSFRLLTAIKKSFLTALLFTLYLIPHTSYSQSVSATLDRDKILLGEQVTLELKAEGIKPQTSSVINWFSIPDTINHIEVVKRSAIDTIAVNGTVSYIQNITLTSFDSGNWQLPPLQVILQNENDKKDTLRANDISIQILPVDVSNMQQYHPMKDIIDVDVQPDYLLIAGIVITIILLAMAAWFFFFRKKKEVKPELKPAAALSLFETAIEQLEKLQKSNLPAQPFYTKLDEICRTFIQNQLHIRALQLTSDELMVQLNVYIQPDARTSFYQLLRLVNAVKFAKYIPGDAQKEADIETAKAAIQHIYFHLQHSLLQHAK